MVPLNGSIARGKLTDSFLRLSFVLGDTSCSADMLWKVQRREEQKQLADAVVAFTEVVIVGPLS